MFVQEEKIFAGKVLKIHICTMDGTEWLEEITEDTTVEKLKEKCLKHYVHGSLEDPKTLTHHKLIHAATERVLIDTKTVADENLKDKEVLLLIKKRPPPTAPKMADVSAEEKKKQDNKAPDKDAIQKATANLSTQHTDRTVTQHNIRDFQTELRKILVSLIEVAQKLLALNPDAVELFKKANAMLDEDEEDRVDEMALQQLTEMGFAESRAIKALRLNHMSVTQAMEWLIEHVDDPTVDTPLPGQDSAAAGATAAASNASSVSGSSLLRSLSSPSSTEEVTRQDELTEIFKRIRRKREFRPDSRAVIALMEMGFDEKEVIDALRVNNNQQDAAILIRNRATDLDARMHDGTTPLILAARLAVEGMVEELINCHADVNAIDDFGKSALHWAAAVNNIEAAIVLLKNGANKDMQNNKEETPLFLAAREGSYETAKVLLDHFANREITDHMDRLPRDIAQERMHHDIVRLMDEYNLVRSPQMHAGSLSTTLSPPLCSPNGYLGSIKQSQPQGTCLGKKSRKPSVKGVGCKDGKDMKVKKKNSQDGKSGSLLDSSAVLSPVDSLGSPHGYVSDVASPPMMTSPFQQSPSVSLMQGMSDPHLAVNHMVLPSKQDLARMQFDPLPPRLTHLAVSGSSGQAAMNGQCDWISRMHSSMTQAGQFNPIRGGPAGQVGLHQTGQHGIMGSHHNNHATSLSQMISYQGIPNGRLAPPPHMMQQQAQQIQQMQNLQQIQQQQQSIQLQHQSSNTGNSQNFINSELSSPELQPGTGNSSIPIHTILPQDTQIRSTSMNQSIPSTQFLTPPSQHSYTGPLDNTPNHQVQVPDHPFLTPSPGSPDQWSSSSPHSNMSDWSEGISSPPTSLPSQIGPTRTV